MNRRQRDQRKKDRRARRAVDAKAPPPAIGQACRMCGKACRAITCDQVRETEGGRIAHARYDEQRGADREHAHTWCKHCGHVAFLVAAARAPAPAFSAELRQVEPPATDDDPNEPIGFGLHDRD